jgi:ankyrin repeat protein
MYHDGFQVYELLDKWNHQGPPNPKDLKDLFDRDPAVARQEFLFGQTLLHKCMEFYSNRLDLVHIFLEAYPEALAKADDNGFLPIHRALISGSASPSLELIKLCIHECPESILEVTPLGALPLHLACNYRSGSIDIVQYLVDIFPDAVQCRDNEGQFPLDHALDANDPQVEVVELLVQQYPVVLSFLDDQGRLPLHRVLRKHRNRYDGIVNVLVEYCPGALRLQDAQGQTVLLQACQDNNSLSQVYSLVRGWPEQITTQCELTFQDGVFNGEMLPSALASQSVCLHRVQEWVRLHPEVVLSPDLQGRLPLHYAAISSSEDVVDICQFLMEESKSKSGDEEYYSGCAVADHHGRLPLHYAAAAASGPVVDLFMDLHPEGLVQADKDGRLAWHYADCARQDGVYDRTCELYPDLALDLDLVPEEIRWDIIQIVRDT